MDISKLSRLALILLIAIVDTAAGRDQNDCSVTIPAGAITNGENLGLTLNLQWKSARGGDPGLIAFSQLSNDTTNALSFYERVSNTPTVQEDETLQIVDEQVLFGEALACRAKSCHLVFIRPVTQIAQHWLIKIQQDYEALEAASTGDAGAKFVDDLRSADAKQGSVWSKLVGLYCQLEPDGHYHNLSDAVTFCRGAGH